MTLANWARFPLREPVIARTPYNFIRTFTGRKFWPLDPKADEVQIEDIAHALSLLCRFTGHCYCFYSVADHSVRVSRLAETLTLQHWAKMNRVPPRHVRQSANEVALWGLLHDASEAYLCDVPRPLKQVPGFGDLYRCFEANLMNAISMRFDLLMPEPPEVKRADTILLNTEGRDLMTSFEISGEPLPETIFPVDTQRAEVMFLRRFYDLMEARAKS